MLCDMARGTSGRIVLEVEPSQKEELYGALTRDGLTLKTWFLARAEEYLSNRNQLALFEARKVNETASSSFFGKAKRVRSKKKPK
jgi:hypothetical protein